MYKLFVTLLVAVASAVSASAPVTNISLRHEGGYTVAVIQGTGEMQYSHQTEVAKDGRPYRVIVDVLGATHQLGTKEFTTLPNCVVSGIRTSQYAVKPEQVVRVVFDMRQETMYQLVSRMGELEVRFPDKSSADFAAWNTSDHVTAATPGSEYARGFTAPQPQQKSLAETATPAKNAEQANQIINQDRLASLQPATATPSVTSPAPKPEAIPPVAPTTSPAESKPQAAAKELAMTTPGATEPAPPKTTTGPTPVTSGRHFTDSQQWVDPGVAPKATTVVPQPQVTTPPAASTPLLAVSEPTVVPEPASKAPASTETATPVENQPESTEEVTPTESLSPDLAEVDE